MTPKREKKNIVIRFSLPLRERRGLVSFWKWKWMSGSDSGTPEKVCISVWLLMCSWKVKSCGTKWKRSAAVKYHFRSYPLSAVTHFVSPVLHIPVKAIALTSLLLSPDQSAVCLASVSGSSVPTHYHRSLALPLGLVGTLVSVKSNHGNKAAFPKAKPGPSINRT